MDLPVFETDRSKIAAAVGNAAWTAQGVLLVDAGGCIRYASSSLAPLLARDPDGLIGTGIDALLPDLCFLDRIDAGAIERQALRATTMPDRVAVLVTIQPLPQLPGLHALELQVAGQRLGVPPSLHPLARSMDQSADAVIVTDREGVIQHVNAAFEAMTGYARVEVIGRTPALLGSGHQSREFYCALWASLKNGREFRGIFVNRRKSGETFHEEKTIRPLVDEHGRITHFMSTGRNVSGRVRLMERLARAATHDPLTDLPNRGLFYDRLDQAVRHTARTGNPFAVLVVDIDRFKAINDVFGHVAGDAVIRAVGERLQRCVRAADTVARIGGDEFGVLLLDQADAAVAARVLDEIVHAFAAPIDVEGRPIAVSVSVGACVAPAGGADAHTLVRWADRAMYGAKRAGGSGYRLSAKAPEAAAYGYECALPAAWEARL
jgi:diguanylate cyclase (GGDEF)-like protein/PAS domain S-box-containing protein